MTQSGSEVGTQTVPLRVAIIGTGPSGFYAADSLLKQSDVHVEVDMFDRLPTPYGLVRGGVAPDHQKIKSVTKVYEKIAAHPHFRLYGNILFGTDVTHADLKTYYNFIIYAVGAQTDRHLGIPGEDLPGSHAATEFVGWYNAHPDYRDLTFDLSQENVAVIGNGNVAMDVARILASTYDELRKTDIADYALDALRNSRVSDIYILGRRGPAQAAFTNPELKELGEMEDAEVVVRPEDGSIDALSAADLAAHPDPMVAKNLQTLAKYVEQPPLGKPRRIHMRFLVSPVEIRGNGRVESIRLVKNVLQAGPDGSLRAKAAGQYEDMPVGLVFRSIGYVGVALPGVPFDPRAGVIPNEGGRVFDQATGQIVPGEYVVGWIKRGATGIIGTNKPDSQATVDALLADLPMATLLSPENASREAVEGLLRERKPNFTSFVDWLALDQREIANGQQIGRPRLKFSRVDDMLAVVEESRQTQTATPATERS